MGPCDNRADATAAEADIASGWLQIVLSLRIIRCGNYVVLIFFRLASTSINTSLLSPLLSIKFNRPHS